MSKMDYELVTSLLTAHITVAAVTGGDESDACQALVDLARALAHRLRGRQRSALERFIKACGV